MANEATVTVVLSFTKGTIPPQTLSSGPIPVTVTGTAYNRQTQNLPTSKTALRLGDVSTPGLILVHNCDAVNFVSLYANGTDAAAIKVKAGEWQLFRFDPAAVPEGKADTAAADLEFLLLPD